MTRPPAHPHPSPAVGAKHASPAPAPPRWLGEALTTCAQFLFEHGAVEVLALHGAAVLYTNIPLDLDRGRWLLVRFPAPPHEVAPQLLALVAPLPPVETFRRNVSGNISTVDPEGDPDG